MDNKLLEALQNLSESLDFFAEVLSEKKASTEGENASPVTQALLQGDFSETIGVISADIKSVKSDTEKILENQAVLLSQNPGDRMVANVADETNQEYLTRGTSNIILMAGAILALGAAFNIVGEVDPLSVLSLSMAVFIMSKSFEDIGSMSLSISNVMNTGLYLVAMSAGVLASSLILANIAPISTEKMITAILLAGVFGALSYGMGRVIDSLEGRSTTDILRTTFFVPVVFPAMSLGIALSSYALGLIQPISLSQAFTAILISGSFVLMSYALNAITSNVDKVAENAASLVIAMGSFVAMSGAVLATSHILQGVQPITSDIFLTTAGISILFIGMAFSLALMSDSLDKIKPSHLLILPGIFLGTSAAIVGASIILQEYQPMDFMDILNAGVLGVALAATSLVMIRTISLMGNLDPKSLLIGGIAILGTAAVIAGASHILALGVYDESGYPSLGWALGVGASMVGFAGAAIVLGLIATSGVGAIALIAGGVAVLGVAAVIAGTSHILLAGNYTGGPTIEWATATGISLLAFGTAMGALGAIIVGTLGLGAVALQRGADGVRMVANSIVDTSFILAGGNYTGGPTKEWSGGVAMAIGAFSPVYGMLMANNILSIFGAGVSVDSFASAIRTISGSITTAAEYFYGKDNSVFQGGPRKEWAEGVGGAIGAFSPVYGMLMANNILSIFGGGVSINDFTSAINLISQSIVSAAEFFYGKDNSIFQGGPRKEWAEGVGGAIQAFAPIFKIVQDSSGFFGSSATPDAMVKGVDVIVDSLVKTAVKLSVAKSFFDSEINPGFITSLTRNLVGYSYLVNKLNDEYSISASDNRNIDRMVSGMTNIAGAYDKLAVSLNNFSDSLTNLNENKLNSITRLTGHMALLAAMSVDSFGEVMDRLDDKSGMFSKLLEEQGQGGQITVGGGVVLGGGGVDNRAELIALGEKLDMLITLMGGQLEVGKKSNSHLETIEENTYTKGSYRAGK